MFLRGLKRGYYSLTPAYDLLSTALVIPEDTEELALTINGKKRKIKHSDFVKAMSNSNLDDKIINNIFSKFYKVIDKWFDFIDISFLQKEMKDQYKALIKNRIELLGNRWI